MFDSTEILRLEQIAVIIGDLLISETAKEWKAQGHDLTGAYVNSLESIVKKEINAVTIEVYANMYGRYLETGVSAARIPFGGGGRRNTGGGVIKSKYIEALIEYVKLRIHPTGGDKAARSIAFAIARKHKREGMPTHASRRFSQTGERTRFIEAMLTRSSPVIENIVSDEMIKVFDTVLENIALDYNRNDYINALTP